VRIVADTNVLISGILWTGTPHLLLEAAGRGRLRLLGTSELLGEIEESLERPRFVRRLSRLGMTPRKAVAIASRDIEMIEVSGRRSFPGLRDPDDAYLVETALVGRARFVVTGDGDLLAWERFRQVRRSRPARRSRASSRPRSPERAASSPGSSGTG
jgi:putative PIN family toxin of toxin-antitoxin system